MSKIALVGEAFGREEDDFFKLTGEIRPFIGAAGKQLDSLLADAGINRADCYITNVFNLRPGADNDITRLCCRAKDPARAAGLPALQTGHYLRAEYLPHLSRLATELARENLNIVVALGNTACWALLGAGGISKLRGATGLSRLVPSLKVLPTYHPSAVLNQWSLRPVTVLDLEKAKRESAFPEVRRQRRLLWLDPTLADLADFYPNLAEAERIVFDIETQVVGGERQMTNIGFAPSRGLALNIPFFDERKPNNSYWPTLEAELLALRFCGKAFDLHRTGTQFAAQNGMYDISWVWGRYGLPCPTSHDTMLLHHAIQPESPKALDFLGSVYADEMAWKLLSRRKEKKRDS